MAIDYSRIRSLSVRKIERALLNDGFDLRKSRGATRFYRHPDGRRVTLHFHRPGQTLPVGTLKAVLEEQAEWTEEDLIRLGLQR